MSGQLATALVALVAAGAVLSVQAPVNAALARGVGDPVLAAALNFLVGFLFLAVTALVRGVDAGQISIAAVPLWAWLGGFMGGFYIVTLILTVPVTGALTAVAAVIFGQLILAVLLDHNGAFGLPVHELTLPRLAGIGLVLAGVLLTRA